MNFNNVFDFIENEEDFLNFVALYKCYKVKDNTLFLHDSGDCLSFKYNYPIFKTSKNNIKEFKKKIKPFINEEFKIFRGMKCFDKVTMKIDVDKIESMILEYKNEIDKKILENNNKKIFLNYGCFYNNFLNKKEVNIPINEYIYDFINHEECLKLYLFFIYYTQRLENNIQWFRISQNDISIVLSISESKVKEYINILINNNLIERIRVPYKKSWYYEYKIIPYEEFIQNKNDVFIYDSFNKDKNVSKNKKTEIKVEKNKSMINIPSMYYIVYEITDLTNGMKYIGKHKTTNINDGYMGSGRLLKQNQEIKGIENFEKKILHLCKNDKHMAEMEAMEIEKVKAYENNMYYNLKKE